MEIKRSGSRPSATPSPDYFTGAVRQDPVIEAPARLRAVTVTFGLGWAQVWGGKVEEIRTGDVVWFAPDEKHWHGAAATTAMTHIALQEALDGRAVDWLEHVTDDQYTAPA